LQPRFLTDRQADITVRWVPSCPAVNDNCFWPNPYDDSGIFEKDRAFKHLDKDFIAVGINRRSIIDNLDQETESMATQGILKLTVSDTGCGIHPNKLQQIFSEPTSINKMTSGLGLFVSKQICNKMKGEIKAYSKYNCGTSLVICIPAEVVEQPPTRARSLSCAFLVSKPKVLIVDDVQFNLSLLTKYFNELGIERIDTAKNGLEAVKNYQAAMRENDRYSIITLDIDMPVMDGKTAAQKIRRLEREHKVKENTVIFMISENCGELEINECIDPAGEVRADCFLKKPVALEDLKNSILNKMTHIGQ
jgi:FOG: CheY-like receiver